MKRLPPFILIGLFLAFTLAIPAELVQLENVPTTNTITAGPDGLIAREGAGWLERRNGHFVLHLKGSPYEIGYQHGQLLKPQIAALSGKLMALETLIRLKEGKSYAKEILNAWQRTRPFIEDRHKEELRGLADGSGVSFANLCVLNSIPELFHCSGYALWGKATASGELYHGRILDYAMELGYHHFSVIHAVELEGFTPFVNIGYAGFIGSVTGMNGEQVAFGEMGGRGEGLWDGMPMAFLMRKGLEEGKTLKKSLAIFQETPRTCEYYYVISDGKIRDARGLAATPDLLDIVGPNEPYQDKLTRPMEDAVLLSSGSRYQLLCDRVEESFGAITEQQAIDLMRRPVAMKSAIHCVLFVPERLRFHVAIADWENRPASECPYAAFDFKELGLPVAE